jgi:hypothetical protein
MTKKLESFFKKTYSDLIKSIKKDGSASLSQVNTVVSKNHSVLVDILKLEMRRSLMLVMDDGQRIIDQNKKGVEESTRLLRLIEKFIQNETGKKAKYIDDNTKEFNITK